MGLNSLVFFGAVMAFLGVGLGAFGSHALRSRIPGERLAIYQTGVQYQLVHALAVLGTAVLVPRLGPLARWAGWLFVAGIVFFSGSLYGLALERIRGKWGMLTPFGGLLFLVGWGCLAVAAVIR